MLSAAIHDPEAQRRLHGYVTALVTEALIALDDGRPDDGERGVRRALQYAEAVGVGGQQTTALAYVALGRAHFAARRITAARTEFERGVALLCGGIMGAQLAYALLWTVPVVQASGDGALALALVEEAESLLASFDDAGILTALLRSVRRRLELARRRRRDPHSNALTNAELALLSRLRSAKSQREIAREQSVSINTVKSHCSAIYRKLGVRCREDAVVRATERGLLLGLPLSAAMSAM